MTGSRRCLGSVYRRSDGNCDYFAHDLAQTLKAMGKTNALHDDQKHPLRQREKLHGIPRREVNCSGRTTHYFTGCRRRSLTRFLMKRELY
jgi:hypothetical protein